MQHRRLQFGQGLRVVLDDDHSQEARMTLAPGETEGGPVNRHRGADPWPFVVGESTNEARSGRVRPAGGFGSCLW